MKPAIIGLLTIKKGANLKWQMHIFRMRFEQYGERERGAKWAKKSNDDRISAWTSTLITYSNEFKCI